MISDGTQTGNKLNDYKHLFESDVISDGTQTAVGLITAIWTFESDVISDGTQTLMHWPKLKT